LFLSNIPSILSLIIITSFHRPGFLPVFGHGKTGSEYEPAAN